MSTGNPDKDRHFRSYMENVPIEGFQIDEALWGPGSTIEIQLFLVNEYNPRTMPVLAAGDVKGREGIWLLGWDNEGTEYEPLLVHIFGPEYADERLLAIRTRERMLSDFEGRFGLGKVGE
jgi:hypothetical protein